MRKIRLTQGKFALVDDADFKWLNKRKWCVHRKRDDTYYASWHGRIDMHRFILGLTAGDGKIVDHKNRNTLDNRRSNIRVVSTLESGRNRGLQSNNTSGHTGVCWCKQTEKWMTSITVNHKTIFLGRFDDIKDAITARQLGEDKFWVKEV